jgi:hypothetical protein
MGARLRPEPRAPLYGLAVPAGSQHGSPGNEDNNREGPGTAELQLGIFHRRLWGGKAHNPNPTVSIQAPLERFRRAGCRAGARRFQGR